MDGTCTVGKESPLLSFTPKEDYLFLLDSAPHESSLAQLDDDKYHSKETNGLLKNAEEEKSIHDDDDKAVLSDCYHLLEMWLESLAFRSTEENHCSNENPSDDIVLDEEMRNDVNGIGTNNSHPTGMHSPNFRRILLPFPVPHHVEREEGQPESGEAFSSPRRSSSLNYPFSSLEEHERGRDAQSPSTVMASSYPLQFTDFEAIQSNGEYRSLGSLRDAFSARRSPVHFSPSGTMDDPFVISSARTHREGCYYPSMKDASSSIIPGCWSVPATTAHVAFSASGDISSLSTGRGKNPAPPGPLLSPSPSTATTVTGTPPPLRSSWELTPSTYSAAGTSVCASPPDWFAGSVPGGLPRLSPATRSPGHPSNQSHSERIPPPPPVFSLDESNSSASSASTGVYHMRKTREGLTEVLSVLRSKRMMEDTSVLSSSDEGASSTSSICADLRRVEEEEEFHSVNECKQTEDGKGKLNLEAEDFRLLEEFMRAALTIPVDDNGKLTSLGSTHHHSGLCRPCHFHNSSKRPAGCRKGVACMFCHFAHSTPGKSKISGRSTVSTKRSTSTKTTNRVDARPPKGKRENFRAVSLSTMTTPPPPPPDCTANGIKLDYRRNRFV